VQLGINTYWLILFVAQLFKVLRSHVQPRTIYSAQSLTFQHMHTSISGPRFRALHTEIVDRVKSGEFPSVSIGVLHRGQTLWRESIGFADKEKNRPATPNTPFGLASLGKSITATGVMVLVDRLDVNLNAPIVDYVGADLLRIYEGEPEQVTVRRVLNMTAGIPHGHMIFNSPEHLWSYSIDTLVANRGLVVFPPGEIYLHSNFSYVLLEKLISDVSGIPFHEFLKTEVFDPLDMRNAYVSPDKPMETAAPAAPYHQDGVRIPPLQMLPRNSLGIYASLDDLLYFAKFQLNTGNFIQRPFFERTLEKMHDLHGEAPGSMMTLGFARSDLDGERYWLLTNGRAAGMQATLSMIPAEDLAVVCLINATGQDSDDLAFRITDLLLPGFLDRALRTIEKYEIWSNRPYKPIVDLLGDWAGTIQVKDAQIPIELSFQESGMILAAFGGGSKTSLSGVGYRNGLLSGDLTAVLPMEEAQYEPHPVTLSLRLKEGKLSGFATAEINNLRGNFSLAGYLSLTRGKMSEKTNEEIIQSAIRKPEETETPPDVIDSQFVPTESQS
jgi:CubicO group peptidase (beta-lactamase class C family)